jgi:hypothetical protein
LKGRGKQKEFEQSRISDMANIPISANTALGLGHSDLSKRKDFVGDGTFALFCPYVMQAEKTGARNN